VRTLPSRFRQVGAAVVLGALVLMVWGAFAEPAGAQQRCAEGCVDVVAVDGIIDEIEADFIISSVGAANASGEVVAVVLQFDSPGVAVSDERLDQVARAIAESEVPVSVWIGAAGSTALGGAAELVQVAASSGITPGSDIGDVGEQRLDPEEFGRLFPGERAEALTRVFTGEEAVEAGLVSRFSPTLVEHVSELDQVETREVVGDDGETRLEPIQDVRFSKLPLQTQLMHTAASPSVAYLLLVLGLGLLLFEFFTAGVGIAGVVGAGFLVLGSFGTAELPFTPWALGLLLFSMLAFAIDMQTGIPRLWTIIGMVAFTVGSVFLFVEFRPTWIALVVGVAGMGATVFSGMPAMIRTRFATPTIGRDWMIGELGEVDTDVDPVGRVLIRGALWRARTNRATPVHVGERIRVVAIDGLVLEVEPEEGGAIDYREMRNRRKGGGDGDETEVEAADGGADGSADAPAEDRDGGSDDPPAGPVTR
jgi:membrane-bound serine protease (ClpP class)